MSDYLAERKEMFDAVIRSLGKVTNGKPDISAYFATTDTSSGAREIKAAFKNLERRLQASGYFHSVSVNALDRDDIIELWLKSKGVVECTLPVFSQAAFPKSDGIDESYVATVKAKEFVDRVLCDDQGMLRQSIFEENVRSFGGDEIEVNMEIGKSLRNPSSRSRFGILNNGVTIVAPDIRMANQELYMKGFQIVNGCQTSNVLYNSRAFIDSKVTLMLKVVKTTDSAIVDEVVRSTNKQTIVEDHQFLATLDSVKAIERYFVARAESEDHRLYFERRANQFEGDYVKKMRIFDVKEVARCAGAMFFDRPDLASRYPTQLTNELRDVVFSENNVEELFYTSAFALYRLKLHLGNKRVPPALGKYRWFILMALKCVIAGKKQPLPTSAGLKKLCKKIDEFARRNDESALATWTKIGNHIDKNVVGNRDKLKNRTFVKDIADFFFGERQFVHLK